MADQVEQMVFGKTLAEMGRRYPDLVVLDADLARATETYFFKAEFPDRYFDLGIAEQNMVGVAAGLALSGRRVIAGTFACFIGRRVADQVAISVCYCRAPVKLIGVEPGFSSGRNGASHQAVEDIAIMRSLPNMHILIPADATEHRRALEFLMDFPYPAYMRVQRGNLPVMFDPQSYAFEFGKASLLREGSDVTLIAAGNMLARALAASDALAADGIRARVLNMHTVKPLDREAVVRAAEETGAIVTAEDHSIHGGLGSAVAEAVAEDCPVPVVRVGIPDTFGEVGSVEYLADKFGLSAGHIARAARRAVGMSSRRATRMFQP